MGSHNPRPFCPKCSQNVFLPPQSAHISSSDDASGVLLEGKFAEHPTPTFPPSTPFGQSGGRAEDRDGRGGGDRGETLSAEEMDQRMREHLERKALEW